VIASRDRLTRKRKKERERERERCHYTWSKIRYEAKIYLYRGNELLCAGLRSCETELAEFPRERAMFIGDIRICTVERRDGITPNDSLYRACVWNETAARCGKINRIIYFSQQRFRRLLRAHLYNTKHELEKWAQDDLFIIRFFFVSKRKHIITWRSGFTWNFYSLALWASWRSSLKILADLSS